MDPGRTCAQLGVNEAQSHACMIEQTAERERGQGYRKEAHTEPEVIDDGSEGSSGGR